MENNVKEDTMNKKVKRRVKYSPYDSAKMVAVCGIFGGLALLLYLVEMFRIPMGFIFTTTPFLKLNFSDIPIMIAGFCYGPVAGGIIVSIKTLLKCIMTKTAFIGEAADLIASMSFVITASIIYRFNKTKKGALIGLGVGTIISVIAACFANWYILIPAFAPKLRTAYTIFACILPFNLIKNVLVSIIVFFIYKKISSVIHKYGAKR